MKTEYFTYTPAELAQQLTQQTHQTLYWLNRNGHLANDLVEELAARLVVTPIANNQTFGSRILSRFFRNTDAADSYVFPITELDSVIEPIAENPKAKVLELIKNEVDKNE